MAIEIKHRRGTTAAHSTFTGGEGEITVDLTKKTAVVHDGATVGGIPLARADGVAPNSSQLLGGTWASPGAIGSTAPNSGAFTTLTTTSAISSGGFYTQSVDYAEVRMRATSGANLNGWRLTSGINGASDGTLTIQHSTDNFAANFTSAIVADASGNVGLGTSPSSRLDIGSTSATVVDFKLRNSVNTAVTYVNSDGSVVINGINAYPMVFATSGVERMRIDSSGNVGVGVAPATKLDCFNSGTADTIAQVRNGTTSVQIQAGNGYSYINTYTAHPMLFGVGNVERMRIDSGGLVGISATPTAAPACYLNVAQGVQATGTSPQMQLYASSAGAGLKYFRVMNDGSSGAINFQRVNDAYSTATNVFSIDSNNNVLIAGAGLGYGTGAGGTVTQATSKSTTVTLNKPSGQITMNNAALGAGSSVAFQMNNSVFGINDTCIGSINTSLAGYSSYEVKCFTFAGGVVFSIKNISGGSLSDAVVVDFRLLKGATS